MANLINADPTNGLKLISDSSSEIQLQANGSTIATVNSSGITMTSGKNLVTTGPTFFAYHSAVQTLTFTGSYIKAIFNAEEWDSDSCYDTSTGFFTPNVAGYYQLNVYMQLAAAVNQHGGFYKNGSAWAFGTNDSGSTEFGSQNSTLIYMNGTTDYVAYHLYVGSTVNTANARSVSWFSGHLVKAT